MVEKLVRTLVAGGLAFTTPNKRFYRNLPGKRKILLKSYLVIGWHTIYFVGE